MPIADDVRADGGGAVAIDGNGAQAIAIDELRLVPLRLVGGKAVPAPRRVRVAGLTQAAIKRGFDLAFATTVLLVSLPLIALVSLMIVLDSRGPVFYRAERVGHGGRPLRMLKFRKMHHNASGAPLTMSEDARFTRIGRLLARTKIDELPQLWHVLRGEMSLIGPRPEDPGFVAERSADYQQILAVRPGVTGLSQIAFAEESEI